MIRAGWLAPRLLAAQLGSRIRRTGHGRTLEATLRRLRFHAALGRARFGARLGSPGLRRPDLLRREPPLHLGVAVSEPAAVRRVMLPPARGDVHLVMGVHVNAALHQRRPVIVVVHVHDPHMAMVPVHVAEEKPERYADRGTPPESGRDAGAI
ncbi:MAG: hypothetical protein ACREUO_05145, partial [Burkholderiales bacterium]